MTKEDKFIKDLFENIHKDDPIKKKWIYKFFEERRKDMTSNLSLDEYCRIMERDEKLKQIID